MFSKQKCPTTITIPFQEHGKPIGFEQFNSVMKSFDERLSREEENRIAKSNEMQKQIAKLEQQLLSAEKKYLVQQEELVEKNKDLNDQLTKVSFLEEKISNLLQTQQHAWDLQCDLNKTENMVNSSAITAIEKRIDHLQKCFGNLNEQQIVECLENINELNCKQEEIKTESIEMMKLYEDNLFSIKELKKRVTQFENKQNSLEEKMIQEHQRHKQEVFKCIYNLEAEQNNLKSSGKHFNEAKLKYDTLDQQVKALELQLDKKQHETQEIWAISEKKMLQENQRHTQELFKCIKNLEAEQNNLKLSEERFNETKLKYETLDQQVTALQLHLDKKQYEIEDIWSILSVLNNLDNLHDLEEKIKQLNCKLINCGKCIIHFLPLLREYEIWTENMWQDHITEQLFIASQNGRNDFAKLFIDLGADANCSEINGWTPLHYSAKYGHLSVVTELINQGANVDVKKDDGWTPLHLASNYGHDLVLIELLKAGADMFSRNNCGQTPLHLASKKKNHAIVNILQNGT